MANERPRYAGEILDIRRIRRAEFAWSVSRPKKLPWSQSISGEVVFVHVDEMPAWKADRPGYLAIPAGFWEVQKNGSIRVLAPVIGFGAPFQIPPGRYHIVVGWGRSWAASRRTVDIQQGADIDDGEPPSPMEIGETAKQRPFSEFTRRGKAVRSRRRIEEEGLISWQNLPRRPLRPPYQTPRGSRRNEKVDPFPDLKAAMQTFVKDIRRARRNIWIAWWALDDDFPTEFDQVGNPVSFLRDEIKAALTANQQLHVYMLVWTLVGWSTPPDPDVFSTSATRARLHIQWQRNDLIGSHHQKFLLADLDDENGTFFDEGAVLWCRGWDGKITYWDLHKHGDPDPYLDVAGDPHQPWHDSALRVVGQQAIKTFEEEFRRRWTLGGFSPPLPGRPAFTPLPSGQTLPVPLIHKEFTSSGPQERWYHWNISRLRRGCYIENQYFDDPDIADRLAQTYLARELGGRALRGAIVICHPDVMSPFFLQRRSSDNIAVLRANTANRLTVSSATGPRSVRRPRGGWSFVGITGPFPLIGSFYHVRVTWRGGGASGHMLRAVGGVACLTMVTPSATAVGSFTPVYLHSKFSIMDSVYMLGSSNISYQSFNRDSEGDVVVDDASEARRVANLFFPNLTDRAAASNLATWIISMHRVGRQNFDMGQGIPPWRPVGLLTEYPYED